MLDLGNFSWHQQCSTNCKKYETVKGNSWVSLGVSCYKELTMSIFEENNASWITFNTLCRPNPAFTLAASREAEKNMHLFFALFDIFYTIWWVNITNDGLTYNWFE